jgi:DNA-binding transcriptional LysR family regulator
MVKDVNTLDIEAVQAFVLTADLKSFTRAAEAMDTTQSTVSLKIKKLEDSLGKRLLDRTPRSVRLSQEGSAFLVAARILIIAHRNAVGALMAERHRLVAGISRHVVGPRLPMLLKQMNRFTPNTTMEIRVSMSRDILDAFDQGALDAAIVLGNDSRRRDGEVIYEEQFGWMAAPDFEHYPDAPLRLATQANPCSVRNMTLAALGDAGIPCTEVFVGGGISTVGAAVSAGLAVAVLGRRVAPSDTVEVGPQLGLPKLPARDVVLYSKPTSVQARDAILKLVATIRATAT